MQYSDIFNSYKNASINGKSTQELMVQVFEKLRNHMQNAKQSLIDQDYVERGKNIVAVVNILETLAKSVVVKDEIVGSEETLKMYEKLGFLVENLVATQAKPEEYDYYIEYFNNLKSIWEDHSSKAEYNVRTDAVSVEITKDLKPTENQNIQGFNKEGKFELIM